MKVGGSNMLISLGWKCSSDFISPHKTPLSAHLTPANHLPLFLTHIAQASRASTHVAMLMRWIAIHQPVRWHIPRYDRACPNQCKRTNRYAAHNDRPCTNRCAIFDERGSNHPVVGAFQAAIGRDCP